MCQLIFSGPTHEQAVTLAAVFQACHLVDQLANTGGANNQQTEVCLSALLNQHPTSVTDLYGSEQALETGIEAMTTLLAKHQGTALYTSNTLIYALSVLTLERQLFDRPVMLKAIAEGIDNANRQAEHFSVTHSNVIANVASLYQQTLSTLQRRIQVKGNAIYLQQPGVAERIRCLLFAAVRSAYLWRQLGGKRYHLLFWRGALIKALKNHHKQ